MVASCQLELSEVISFHLILRQSLSFNWLSPLNQLFFIVVVCLWLLLLGGGGVLRFVILWVMCARRWCFHAAWQLPHRAQGLYWWRLSECQYCAWWVKAGSVKLIPTDLGYPALIPGYVSSVNRSLPPYVSLRDRTDCTHGPAGRRRSPSTHYLPPKSNILTLDPTVMS